MSSFWVSRLVTLALLSAACIVCAGRLAEMHARRESGPDTDLPQEEPDLPQEISKHGIIEIEMERVRGLGGPSGFVATIRADGTFEFEGTLNRQAGKWRGTFERAEFDRLAHFVLFVGYFDLKDDYDNLNITDQPEVFTRVVTINREKLIRNYADTGPIELWAVQERISKILHDAKWDRHPEGPKH